MARQIIVNATPQEARVAIVDGVRLSEIFIERIRERALAGSIYKGRVTRVLPGMQAAFLDIGLAKAAFLHARDFFPIGDDEVSRASNRLDEEDETPAASAATSARVVSPNGDATESAPEPPAREPLPRLEEQLRKGQDLIVQIAKQPLGSKGARVTCNIAMPGRHLVFLPRTDHVGISRRIEFEEERERLRATLESLQSRSGGVIVRTACEGLSKREIQADLRLLQKLWGRVARRAESMPAPALLHSDLDVILRSVRDLLTSDVNRVLIDNRRDFQRVLDFVETVMPRWRSRIELYEGSDPIFERYGIEPQIDRALQRRVWLKSGGHIVIDHTEALTAIDVNTGRFVGKSSQEETILQTNREAVRAIVDQLRLRNIGGLIILDFIDMDHPEHRQQVLEELEAALRADKAKTTILGISELGLVEMTRKRTRESLTQRLCDPCPTCGGRGHVKAVATTAYEVLRRIRREAVMNAPLEGVCTTLHPHVAEFLREHEPAALREIERELGVSVSLQETSTVAPDEYHVSAVAREGA